MKQGGKAMLERSKEEIRRVTESLQSEWKTRRASLETEARKTIQTSIKKLEELQENPTVQKVLEDRRVADLINWTKPIATRVLEKANQSKLFKSAAARISKMSRPQASTTQTKKRPSQKKKAANTRTATH